MVRTALPFFVALSLIACTSREDDPDASTSPIDAGHTDANVPPDAASDAGAPDGGPPDAGCTLECPAIPEECHYEDQDCSTESCGELVCPDPERLCGGLFHGVCQSTEYCDFAIDGACGIADEVGYCRARPASCDTVCEEVCGCDGTTYCNACEAHRAGREVVRTGACAPPDPCPSAEAFGEGEGVDCTDDLLGYHWNGSRCAAVIGCECAGSGCATIHVDQGSCEAAFTECIALRCGPMDAEAVGDCATSIGWAWEGTECQPIVGCSCAGTDCWRAEGVTEADCEIEYAHCPRPI